MVPYPVISRFLINLIPASSCIFFTFLAVSPSLSSDFEKKRKASFKRFIGGIENGGNSSRKTKGVMLKFHRWPSSWEKKKFLKRLRSMGLKKKKVFKSFKMWAVNWPGPLRTFDEALEVCGRLEDFSFLKYCEPNSLFKPLSEASVFSSDTNPGFYPVGFLVAETTRTGRSKEKLRSGNGVQGNNIRTCGVVSSSRSLDGGRLSDYWAQEMIGSDLLKEELIKNSQRARKNFIAVFDYGPAHPHKVGSLIADNEGDHSVLPKLKMKGTGKQLYPVRFYMKHYHTGYPEDYVKVAEEIKNTDRHPSFINNSMGWSEDTTAEALRSLSPPSVIVVAAGNSEGGFNVNESQSRASEESDLILVGAFSHHGFVSDYSSQGNEVQILAPSSPSLNSNNLTSSLASRGGGEITGFTGTSAAAPLVTGSLAGFELMSDYHPSPSESKELLEKTALPTVHSYESPQKNGAGLLNSYKLGMVGKRLKEKCQNKGPRCFQREIKNPSNYQFTVDESLESEVSQVFPSCFLSGEKRGRGGDCLEIERVFNNLRKAVLLNPERKDLWSSLSCIYRKGGFHGNSEGLDRLALASSSREEAVKDLESYLKPFMELPDEELDSHPSNHPNRKLIKSLAMIDKDFLNKLSRGRTLDKRFAAETAGMIGGPKGVSLLKTLVRDQNEGVRSSVAKSAGMIKGPEGISLLKALVNDPSESVRSRVAESARKIGGEEGDKILELLERN